MTMRLFRWLAVLVPLAVLCGCAYPSFNRDTFDVKIRTVTLDPHFPQLKAYQQCVVECAGCSSSCTASVPAEYTFAHFDAASSDRSQIITDSLYGTDTRSFSGVAKLIPSYSFNPSVRVLDTVAEDSYTTDYHQHIAFYRSVATEDGHQVVINLPRERCPVFKEAPYSRRKAELWQPVKFVVVVASQATIFVEMKESTAQCPGLRVQDVLGNVSGIPADLAAHAYRVYTVDFAKDTKRSITADLVIKSLSPPDKVITLQQDPVPDISMQSQAEQFVCRVHTSSTDWHIYSGMAATSQGKVSYSRSCKPVK
jgi:hypothetical protein